MRSFYYEFRRIYCGFNYILTKIISLGEVVFPYFQIGRFEGGVLSELMGFYKRFRIVSFVACVDPKLIDTSTREIVHIFFYSGILYYGENENFSFPP